MKIEVILLSFLLYWDAAYTEPRHQKLNDQIVSKVNRDSDDFKIIGRHVAERWSLNDGGVHLRERRAKEEDSSWSSWRGLLHDAEKRQEPLTLEPNDVNTHKDSRKTSSFNERAATFDPGNKVRNRRSIWKPFDLDMSPPNKDGIDDAFKSGQATSAETQNENPTLHKIIEKPNTESNAHRETLYKRKFSEDIFDDFDDWFLLGRTFTAGDFTRTFYEPSYSGRYVGEGQKEHEKPSNGRTASKSHEKSPRNEEHFKERSYEDIHGKEHRKDSYGNHKSDVSSSSSGKADENGEISGGRIPMKDALHKGNKKDGFEDKKYKIFSMDSSEIDGEKFPWWNDLDESMEDHGYPSEHGRINAERSFRREYEEPKMEMGFDREYEPYSPRFLEKFGNEKDASREKDRYLVKEHSIDDEYKTNQNGRHRGTKMKSGVKDKKFLTDSPHRSFGFKRFEGRRNEKLEEADDSWGFFKEPGEIDGHKSNNRFYSDGYDFDGNSNEHWTKVGKKYDDSGEEAHLLHNKKVSNNNIAEKYNFGTNRDEHWKKFRKKYDGSHREPHLMRDKMAPTIEIAEKYDFDNNGDDHWREFGKKYDDNHRQPYLRQDKKISNNKIAEEHNFNTNRNGPWEQIGKKYDGNHKEPHSMHDRNVPNNNIAQDHDFDTSKDEHWTEFGRRYDGSHKEPHLMHDKKIPHDEDTEEYDFNTNRDDHWGRNGKKYGGERYKKLHALNDRKVPNNKMDEDYHFDTNKDEHRFKFGKRFDDNHKELHSLNDRKIPNNKMDGDYNFDTNKDKHKPQFGKRFDDSHKELLSVHDRKVPNNKVDEEYHFDTNKDQHKPQFGKRFDNSHKELHSVHDRKVPNNKVDEEYHFDSNKDQHKPQFGKRFDDNHKELHSVHDTKVPNNKLDEEYHFDIDKGQHMSQFGKRFDDSYKELHSLHDRKVPKNKVDEEYHLDANKDQHKPQFGKRFDDSHKELLSVHDRKVPKNKMDEEYHFDTNKDQHKPQFGKRFDDSHKELHSVHDRKVPNNKLDEEYHFDTNNDKNREKFEKIFDDSHKELHSKRSKKILNNKVVKKYDIQKSVHSTLHPKDYKSQRGSIESSKDKHIPTEFSLDHKRTENKNIHEKYSPYKKKPPTEFSKRHEKILNKENIEQKNHLYIPHPKEPFIAASRNKTVENHQKQPQNKRHFTNVEHTNERNDYDYSSHHGTPDGKTNIRERANEREYRRKGANLLKSMQIGESAGRNTRVDGEEENASDKHQSVTAEISAGARIMANKRADATKHRESNGGKSTLKENEIAGKERKIENHSTRMHERAREDVRDSSREIEPSKERLDGKVNVNRGGADSAENRGEKWNFLDRGLKINRRNKSTRYELEEKTKSGLFDVENYERAESENSSREMDRRSSKEEEESEDRMSWLPLERMHAMNHAKGDSKRGLIKDREHFGTPLQKIKQFDSKVRFDGALKKIKNSVEWNDKGSDGNGGFQRHEFKGGFLDDSYIDSEDNKRINYNKSGKKEYLHGNENYNGEKYNNIFDDDEKEGQHNDNMEVNYRDLPITTRESEKKNSMKLYDLDEARSENKQKLFKKKSHEIFTKSETHPDNKSKERKHHLKSGEMKEEHVNKYERKNDFINSFNANRGMTHDYEEKETSEVTEKRGITDDDVEKSRMILENDKQWNVYGDVKDDEKIASIMKEEKNIEDKDALVTTMKQLKKNWVENVEANDNRVHEVSHSRYLQDLNKDVKQTPNNPFHAYKRRINQNKEMLQKVSLKGEHSSKYNTKFNEMNDTDLKKGEDLHKKRRGKFNNETPFDKNVNPSLEEEKQVALKEKEKLKIYNEKENRIFLRNRDAKEDKYSAYLEDKGNKVSPSLKTKARINTLQSKTPDEIANADNKRHTEKAEENETPRKLSDYSSQQKNKENYKDESSYYKFNQADYFEKKSGRPNSKGEHNKLRETTKIPPTINYLKDNDKSETLGSLNFKTVAKASQENSDISSEDTMTHEEDSRENKFNVHPERKDKLKVVKSGINKNHNSKVRAFVNSGTLARTFEKHDESFAESEEEYVENGEGNEFEASSKERKKLQTVTPGWNENDGSKFVASKNIQTVVSVVQPNEETSSKNKVYVAGRAEPEYDSYLKNKQFQQLKQTTRHPKNHDSTIIHGKNVSQDERKIVKNDPQNNETFEKLNNRIYQQRRYENMRSGSKFIQEEQFGREYGGINEDKKGNIAFKDKKKLETVMYDLREAPASANVVKVASTSQKDDEILLDRGAVYVPDAEGNESRFYSKKKEIRAQTGSSEGKTRTSGDGDDARHKKSRVANGEDLERRKTLQPANAEFLHRGEAANTSSELEENNEQVEVIKNSSKLKSNEKTDGSLRRNEEKFHERLSTVSESDEEHFNKKYGLVNENSKVYDTGFQLMEREKEATSDLNEYYESESMTTGDTRTSSNKLKQDKEYFAHDRYIYGKNPKEKESIVYPQKKKKVHIITPDPNANQSIKMPLSNPKTISNNLHPINDIMSQNTKVHNNSTTRYQSSAISKTKNGTTLAPIPNKTYNSEMLSSNKIQSPPEKDTNYEATNDKFSSNVESTAIKESTKSHEHLITERGSNVDHVLQVAATANAETAADVSDSNGNDGSHSTAVEAHTTKVKENGIRGWRLNQGDVSEEQPAAGTHGVISPDESARHLESRDANDRTYMKGREHNGAMRNFTSKQKSRDSDNSDDVSGFLNTESVGEEESNDTLNGNGVEDDKRGVEEVIGFDEHVKGVESKGSNDLMGTKRRKGEAGGGDLIEKGEKLGDDNFNGIPGFLDIDNGNDEKIGIQPAAGTHGVISPDESARHLESRDANDRTYMKGREHNGAMRNFTSNQKSRDSDNSDDVSGFMNTESVGEEESNDTLNGNGVKDDKRGVDEVIGFDEHVKGVESKGSNDLMGTKRRKGKAGAGDLIEKGEKLGDDNFNGIPGFLDTDNGNDEKIGIQPAAGTHGVISPDESARHLESRDANDRTYMKGREHNGVMRNFTSNQKSTDSDNSDDVSGFLNTESVGEEESNDTLNGNGVEDDKRGVEEVIGFDKHVEGVESKGSNDLMGTKRRKGEAGGGDLIEKGEKLGDDNFNGIPGFLDTDNGNDEKIGRKVDKEERHLDGPKAEGEFGKESSTVTNRISNFDASSVNSQRNVKEGEKVSKVPVDVGNFKETAVSSFAINEGSMRGVDDEKSEAYDENGSGAGEGEKDRSIQPIDGNSAAKHKLFGAENGNLENRSQEKMTAWDSKAKQISDGVELAKVQENESNDNFEAERGRKTKEDDEANIHNISKNVNVVKKPKTITDEAESERFTKLSGTSTSDQHDRSKSSELNDKFDSEPITVKQTTDMAQKKEKNSNDNPNKTQESQISATKYDNGLADIETLKKMTANMKKDSEYISRIKEDKIALPGSNSNKKSDYPIFQNTLHDKHNNDFKQIDEKSENTRTGRSRVEDKEFDGNIRTETNESVKNGRKIGNANSVPAEKKDNMAEHDFNTIPTVRNSQSTLSDSEETRNRENMKKPALDLNESNEFESLSAADARMDAVKTANDEYGEGVPRVRDKEGEKEEALYDLIGKEAPESSSAVNNQTKRNNEKVDNQKDLVRSVGEKNLNIRKEHTTHKRTELQTEKNASTANSEMRVDYYDRVEKSKLISGMKQENTSDMENLKAHDLVAKGASKNLPTMKNKLDTNNDATGKLNASVSTDQEKDTIGEEKGEALPYDFIKKKEPDKQPPATTSRDYDSYKSQEQDESITKITKASESIGDENKDLKSYDMQENEENDVLSDADKSNDNSVGKDATIAARLNKDKNSVEKITPKLKIGEGPHHSSITHQQADFNKEKEETKTLAGIWKEANKNNAVEDEVTANNLNKDENSVEKITSKLKKSEGPEHSSITNQQADFNKENEETKTLAGIRKEANKNNAIEDEVTANNLNKSKTSVEKITSKLKIGEGPHHSSITNQQSDFSKEKEETKTLAGIWNDANKNNAIEDEVTTNNLNKSKTSVEKITSKLKIGLGPDHSSISNLQNKEKKKSNLLANAETETDENNATEDKVTVARFNENRNSAKLSTENTEINIYKNDGADQKNTEQPFLITGMKPPIIAHQEAAVHDLIKNEKFDANRKSSDLSNAVGETNKVEWKEERTLQDDLFKSQVNNVSTDDDNIIRNLEQIERNNTSNIVNDDGNEAAEEEREKMTHGFGQGGKGHILSNGDHERHFNYNVGDAYSKLTKENQETGKKKDENKEKVEQNLNRNEGEKSFASNKKSISTSIPEIYFETLEKKKTKEHDLGKEEKQNNLSTENGEMSDSNGISEIDNKIASAAEEANENDDKTMETAATDIEAKPLSHFISESNETNTQNIKNEAFKESVSTDRVTDIKKEEIKSRESIRNKNSGESPLGNNLGNSRIATNEFGKSVPSISAANSKPTVVTDHDAIKKKDPTENLSTTNNQKDIDRIKNKEFNKSISTIKESDSKKETTRKENSIESNTSYDIPAEIDPPDSRDVLNKLSEIEPTMGIKHATKEELSEHNLIENKVSENLFTAGSKIEKENGAIDKYGESIPAAREADADKVKNMEIAAEDLINSQIYTASSMKSVQLDGKYSESVTARSEAEANNVKEDKISMNESIEGYVENEASIANGQENIESQIEGFFQSTLLTEKQSDVNGNEKNEETQTNHTVEDQRSEVLLNADSQVEENTKAVTNQYQSTRDGDKTENFQMKGNEVIRYGLNENLPPKIRPIAASKDVDIKTIEKLIKADTESLTTAIEQEKTANFSEEKHTLSSHKNPRNKFEKKRIVQDHSDISPTAETSQFTTEKKHINLYDSKENIALSNTANNVNKMAKKKDGKIPHVAPIQNKSMASNVGNTGTTPDLDKSENQNVFSISDSEANASKMEKLSSTEISDDEKDISFSVTARTPTDTNVFNENDGKTTNKNKSKGEDVLECPECVQKGAESKETEKLKENDDGSEELQARDVQTFADSENSEVNDELYKDKDVYEKKFKGDELENYSTGEKEVTQENIDGRRNIEKSNLPLGTNNENYSKTIREDVSKFDGLKKNEISWSLPQKNTELNNSAHKLENEERDKMMHNSEKDHALGDTEKEKSSITNLKQIKSTDVHPKNLQERQSLLSTVSQKNSSEKGFSLGNEMSHNSKDPTEMNKLFSEEKELINSKKDQKETIGRPSTSSDKDEASGTTVNDSAEDLDSEMRQTPLNIHDLHPITNNNKIQAEDSSEEEEYKMSATSARKLTDKPTEYESLVGVNKVKSQRKEGTKPLHNSIRDHDPEVFSAASTRAEINTAFKEHIQSSIETSEEYQTTIAANESLARDSNTNSAVSKAIYNEKNSKNVSEENNGSSEDNNEIHLSEESETMKDELNEKQGSEKGLGYSIRNEVDKKNSGGFNDLDNGVQNGGIKNEENAANDENIKQDTGNLGNLKGEVVEGVNDGNNGGKVLESDKVDRLRVINDERERYGLNKEGESAESIDKSFNPTDNRNAVKNVDKASKIDEENGRAMIEKNFNGDKMSQESSITGSLGVSRLDFDGQSAPSVAIDPMDAKVSNDHNQSSFTLRDYQLQEAEKNHNDHTVTYSGPPDLQNYVLDKNDALHQDNDLTHSATDKTHKGGLNESEKPKENHDYINKLSNSNVVKPNFLHEEDARENTLHNFSIGDFKVKMDEVNDAAKGKGLVHSTADETYEEDYNKNEYNNVHDRNSVLSNSKRMWSESKNESSPDISDTRDKNIVANNAEELNDLLFTNPKQTEKEDLGKNEKVTNHPEHNSKPPNSKTMKPNSLNENDSTGSTSQNFNINDLREADAQLNQSAVSLERMTKQHNSNARHLDETHVSASSSNPNREIMGSSDIYADSEVSFAEANRERAVRAKGKTSFEVNAYDSKETETDSEKNRYEVYGINEPDGKRKPSIPQQVQGIHLFAEDAKIIEHGAVKELKKNENENENETNHPGMILTLNQKPKEKDFTIETSTSDELNDVFMNTVDNDREKEETERSIEHDLNKNPSKINSIHFSDTEGITESSATDRKHEALVENKLSALNTQTIASALKNHGSLAKNNIHVHNLNLENYTKLHGTSNEEKNTESNILSLIYSSKKDDIESLSKPEGYTPLENSRINPRNEGSSELQKSIYKEQSPPKLTAETDTPGSQKHVKLNSSHENHAYDKSPVNHKSHNPKSMRTATAKENDHFFFSIGAKLDDAEDTTPKHTSNIEHRFKVTSAEERERNLSLATSSPAESAEVISADKSDVAYGDSDKDRDLSTKLITEIDDDEEGGDQINTRVKDDSVSGKPEDEAINDTRRHDGESGKADEISGDEDIKNKRKQYQFMFSARHYETEKKNRQTEAANYNSDFMTKGSLEKDYNSKDAFGVTLDKSDPLFDETVKFSVKEIDDEVGNKRLLRVEQLETSNDNSKGVINSRIVMGKNEMNDLFVPDISKSRQNSFAKSKMEKSKVANREVVSEFDNISESFQIESQETSPHQSESDEGTESNHPNWKQVSSSDASKSQPRLELYSSEYSESSKENTSDELYFEHKNIEDSTVNNGAHKKFNYTTIEKVHDLKLENVNANKLDANKNMDYVNKISNDIKNELNRDSSDQSKPEKILKMENGNGASAERDLQAVEVKLNVNGQLSDSVKNNSLERKRCKAGECTKNYDADLHDNQLKLSNSLNTANELKKRRKHSNKLKNFLNPRRKFAEWHVNVESNQYNTDFEKYLTSDEFYHKSLDSKIHDRKENNEQKNIISNTSSTASSESNSEDKISKEKESTSVHKHYIEKQNESWNNSNEDHLRKQKGDKSMESSNVEYPTEEINSSKFNARKIEDVTEENAESPVAVNKNEIAKLQVVQRENEMRDSKEDGSSEVSTIGTTYEKSIFPIDSQHPQITKEEVKKVTHKLQRNEDAVATENPVKMLSSRTYTAQDEKQRNMLNDMDKNENSKMITLTKVDGKNGKVDRNDYGILKKSIGTSKNKAHYNRWLLWRKYYSKIKKIDSSLLKKIKPYFAGIQEFENEDRYLRKYKELYEKFTSTDEDSLEEHLKECDYSGDEAVDDLDNQYVSSSTTTDNKSDKFDRKNVKDWPWFSTKSIDPSLQAKGGSSLSSVDAKDNDFHYSSDNGKTNEKFRGSMPHFQKVRLPSEDEDSNNEFESKGQVGSSEFVRSNVGLSCGGKLGFPVSMSSMETQSPDQEGSKRIVAAESAGIAELRKSEVINDVLQTTSESVTSRQVPHDDVKSTEVGDIYGDVLSDVKEEDVNRRTAIAVKSVDASAEEVECRFKVPEKEKVDVYIVRRKCRGPVRVTHLRGTTPRLVSYGLIPKKVYERTLDIFAKSKIFSKPYPIRSISR